MVKAQDIPLEQAWENWVACINGNDINSIFQQINLMVWDSAIFQIIIEGRKVQIEKYPQKLKLNGPLHSFIDRHFFQSQSAFIRRLTDHSYDISGDKGVYSICSLIKDILRYKVELTRENYLKLRNLPYDYSEIQNRELEFFRNHPLGKVNFGPSEFNWEEIEEAHQMFDHLSGTSSNVRNPSDNIDEKVFVKLQEKLHVCQDIAKYVDKYVAHSATPQSRINQDVTSSTITLKHISEAHQVLFQVAEFISIVFFSKDHMALLIEKPRYFKFWDTPLIEKGDIDLIRIKLEDYRKETKKWNFGGVEDIWHWVGKI